MKMLLTIALSAILFVLGIVLVAMNIETSPAMITFGMFLVAVSILNSAIQMYFPKQPMTTVELKVVAPKKISKKTSKKRASKTKKTTKKRSRR